MTDSRFYRYTGMAMIINGLVGEHAYGPDEYIDVDFLEKRTNMHLG